MTKNANALFYLVFFVTLSIVIFALFAIIFPSFLMTVFYPHSINLEPFESSVWLVPLICSNSILLVIGFGYYRKKLPHQIYKGIEFILNFEISKKTALLVGIIILAVYIGFTLPELALDEVTQYKDAIILEEALEIWPSTDSERTAIKDYNSRHVRMALLDVSSNIFQNIKFLPFVASILLVVVTFFLTYQITQKRFAGIISMVILLQSHTFLHFDTIAVYENFWVLFYVASLYVINKKWQYSSILYILSAFTKLFIAAFFLASIYYICRASISSRKKLFTLASYGGSVIVILIVFSFSGDTFSITNISFPDFMLAFNALGYALRYDLVIILSLLPLTLGLFFKFRKEDSKADSILVLILTALLSGPVFAMLTSFLEIGFPVLPYRFLPLIVFVAVGIGVLLSRKN